MRSYRDLEVYKLSKALAIRIHKMSLQLPKFKLFEEGGQIRRSSKSTTSMIDEGYGRRRYKAEFIRLSAIKPQEAGTILCALFSVSILVMIIFTEPNKSETLSN